MEMSFIDRLVALVDDFDIAALLPNMDTVIGRIEAFCRLCILIVPLILLGLGLWYLLKPPAEANYKAGYRFYFGMGSVEAWRYTQRLAGLAWSGLGLLLFVIMLIVSLTFGAMDAAKMASTALSCVVWELVLIAICCIAINVIVGMRYDKDGNPRPPRK